MKRRLIWNDIKSGKLLAFSTWAFMALCALLVALTCFLFTDLLGAIDILMDAAQTPDVVQMHAGALDEDALNRFASQREEILDVQVLRFLNLENGTMMLADHSMSDSTQDNGVSVQSPRFDLLLDDDNRPFTTRDGEVWVPMCYAREYSLRIGDTAKMGGLTLTIAGFLRDSQMNSMMSSSKRFVVSQNTYDLLLPEGSEEFLIEFRLMEGADANVITAAYADAALPMNGPTITRPIIRVMNALSDGMMALVILLVSLVMLLISMLCIRFTLLSRLESDRREIGMLKAVGIHRKDIRSLYLAKYLLLSLLGAVTGILAALLIKAPMQESLQALYGKPGSGAGSLIAALIGAAVVEGIILLSVLRTLKRTEKMNVIEALNGWEKQGKTKKISGQSVLIVFVVAACMFLMAVPQNLSSTLASPGFITYMGIGSGADVRIDIRQTDDINGKAVLTGELLEADPQVERFVSLQTQSWPVILANDSRARLPVELGDLNAYPVNYSKGRIPQQERELALSVLLADDLELQVGDTIDVLMGDQPVEFTVCGIYSDITNGGKTAKAVMQPSDAAIMSSIFYISLNTADGKAWAAQFEDQLTGKDVSAKVVDIPTFVTGTYGPTLRMIETASSAARYAAIAVVLIVITLFANLLVAKDRNDIALQKALGFTSSEVIGKYVLRLLLLALIGIVLGAGFGIWPGEAIAGVLLSSLGAAGFRFIIAPGKVFLVLPLLLLIAVLLAMYLGLAKIRRVRPYECCVGRE